MVDIFTEVEEDLRRERAKRLWDKYGWIVTGVLLAVVAGVAAFQGWRWYEARQAAAASDRYMAVVRTVETGGTATPDELAPLISGAPRGYATLSTMLSAGLTAKAGLRDQALAQWRTVAADAAAPQSVRELATLLSVLHRLDDGDPAALSAELQALDTPGGTFRHSARELQAVLAERQGRTEEAISILRSLAAAADAPTALRNRAAEMLGAKAAPPASGS